jgi:TonB family protein
MHVSKPVVACVILAIFVAGGSTLHAQDSLVAARQLYASAEYENALALLDRLSSEGDSHEDRQSIELYRTLCLMAVGRRAEADRVIEAMLASDPLYRPGDELSPRVRSAFADVKTRVLPAIVQLRYGQAKAAFDDQEFEAAASGFRQVVAVLDDPDLATAAAQPPLADLRTLAAGFRDLSVSAIPPSPPAVPAAPVDPVPPPLPRLAVYTSGEPDVVAPRALRQDVPQYPGTVPAGGVTEGVVEVLINESGLVESASMVAPLAHAAYNRMVLAAAEGWLYHPATVGGVPVKFRKRIQLNIAPARR